MEFDVRLCLGPHRTARDAEVMMEKVISLQPDIIAPEFMGYTAENISALRAYIRGTAGHITNVERYIDTQSGWKEHSRREVELMRASGTPVAFTDIPFGHPWFLRAKQEPGFLDPAGTWRRWEDFCAYVRHYTRAHAALECEREDENARSFAQNMEKALRAYPSFQRQACVRVALIRGSLHTRLGHVLRENGFGVRLHYTSPPASRHTWDDELQIRYKRSPRARPTDEDAFRAWLTREFYFSRLPRPDDSRKLIRFHRALASVFTPSELRRIFRAAREGEQWEAIEEILARRHIQLPQDSESVSSFAAELSS